MRILKPCELEDFDPEFYNYTGPKTMKWDSYELSRAVDYDGEKVWNGEWFAGPLYPGPRLIVVFRPPEHPPLLDAKRETWPTGGAMVSKFWEYRGRPIVLDGVLANRGRDGRFDFATITRGMHLPPGSVLLADDAYAPAVFKAGAGTKPFTERRKALRAAVEEIPDDRVIVTNYKRIESRKQFDKLRRQCLAVEGFGMVLRRDVPYRSGKSGNVLKIRPE